VISDRQLQLLTKSVVDDDNVCLAVAFSSPVGERPDDHGVNLLIDSNHSDVKAIRRFTSKLCKRLRAPVHVYPLDSARPAALLMRQILSDGQVVKDVKGQWEQLQEQKQQIIREAQDHEHWNAELRQAISWVIGADGNVKLAVQIDPLEPPTDGDERNNLVLVIDCVDDSKETVESIYEKLQNTGYAFTIYRFREVREEPQILAHMVQTGVVMKDVDQQWEQLQARRQEIINGHLQQRATIKLARQLYGGPGGTASMN
jgi:hypothetical protein